MSVPAPDFDLQQGNEFALPQQRVWTHGSDDPADWSVYTAVPLEGEVSRTARGPLFEAYA